MQRLRDTRGIALPLAIFALVIVGVLVASSFFIGRQEQLVGRNTVRLNQAFASAEAGAQLSLASWDPIVYNATPVGGSVAFGGNVTGSGWYRGSVRRLNDLLYLINSEGFSRDSTARQRVGLLVRLRPIEVDITAALKTQGATKIGGSSFINGNDTPPPGWLDCPAIQPTLPGIEIAKAADVTTSGCKDMTCVTGDPKVKENPSISESTLTNFGDASFDELKAMANVVIPGGVRKIEPSLTGTKCNKEDLNNWGDPLTPAAPCGNYFPIIWSEGDLSINGVQGQGVLVVNGNLSVQGGFQFFGPVLVRKALKTTGTGGHFHGGVVAANISLEQNDVLGNAVVNYSYCAVIKALQNTASASLLRERSWVNLY